MEVGDDIVRVKLSTLIGLNRDARSLPLISNSVKAQMAGGHLSAFRGRGMEYHESRPYQPGDDIRAIDWRVTARSGRTHTKVYREERERPVLLWLDLSRSMFFGTRHCFKSVLASRVAALLAWSSVQHGDRLGYLVFSEAQHIEFRPTPGKRSALQFIQQLVAHGAWDQADANSQEQDTGVKALMRLRQVTRPGSLVILLSDFRFVDAECRGQLVELSRHNDVVMIHTYDPFERALPPPGYYRVTDGSASVDIDTANRSVREQYSDRYDQQQQALEHLCKELGLYLIDIATDDDMLATLKTGLGMQGR
ncbi:MAG: DUF58 domain-containing protein [Gammaproteobacteria bacterium]|nr:DUF58 domain-containing protein [Gammaproteobacteria bacterium]